MKDSSERCYISETKYLFRCQHRVMEGECQYDHGPRIVQLKAFYIDKYPVTNRKYGEFLAASGFTPEDNANFLRHWNNGQIPEDQADHPVTWVSYKDASAYASWAGGRLPRDVEWQWAAEGPDKNKWPWGNEFHANYCNAEGAGTTPIDRYSNGVSVWGCWDMTGNTWEWMQDIIDDGKHIFAFVRGGSYYKAPHMWHAEGGPQPANFHLKLPLLNEALNRNATVGFRCVYEVKP